MKRGILLAVLTPFAIGAGVPVPPTRVGVDHGQMGQTWPVIEPDLLAVIKARLDTAQASGKIDALNRQFAEKVTQRVMQPVAVAGMSPAGETRSWEFDPAIVVENDIRDDRGNPMGSSLRRYGGTRIGGPVERSSTLFAMLMTS